MLPEGTRALPLDGPRARTAAVPPGRDGRAGRVDARPPLPRRATGPGIGTWLLGIVLLSGLLALVYFGYKLANTSGAPPTPTSATATAAVASASGTSGVATTSPRHPLGRGDAKRRSLPDERSECGRRRQISAD